jgi:Holliday junction resolvase-like predicted endonuclease
MAEEATADQRRRLLDLAGKWLAKAPGDFAKAQVAFEIAAMKRPMRSAAKGPQTGLGKKYDLV